MLKKVVYFESWYVRYEDDKISHFETEVDMLREVVNSSAIIASYGCELLTPDEVKDIYNIVVHPRTPKVDFYHVQDK